MSLDLFFHNKSLVTHSVLMLTPGRGTVSQQTDKRLMLPLPSNTPRVLGNTLIKLTNGLCPTVSYVYLLNDNYPQTQ